MVWATSGTAVLKADLPLLFSWSFTPPVEYTRGRGTLLVRGDLRCRILQQRKNKPKSSSWHFGVLIIYLLVCFRGKKLFSLRWRWDALGLLLSDTGDSQWICNSTLNLYDIAVICILADGYLQIEDTSVLFISILITLYNGRHSVSSINICWINKLILIGVWAYVIMFVNLQDKRNWQLFIMYLFH